MSSAWIAMYISKKCSREKAEKILKESYRKGLPKNDDLCLHIILKSYKDVYNLLCSGLYFKVKSLKVELGVDNRVVRTGR